MAADPNGMCPAGRPHLAYYCDEDCASRAQPPCTIDHPHNRHGACDGAPAGNLDGAQTNPMFDARPPAEGADRDAWVGYRFGRRDGAATERARVEAVLSAVLADASERNSGGGQFWLRKVFAAMAAPPIAAEDDVAQLNRLLGVDVWDVASFRAYLSVDFDEHGTILGAAVINRKDQPAPFLSDPVAEIARLQGHLAARDGKIAELEAALEAATAATMPRELVDNVINARYSVDWGFRAFTRAQEALAAWSRTSHEGTS